MGTQQTYQTNVPKELIDPLLNNTAQMIGVANRGYQAYQGQRIADWDPSSMQAYKDSQTVGSHIPGQYGTATDTMRQGIGAAMNTPMWSSTVADNYMNPYQQGVTDLAKTGAIRDKQIADTRLNSDMASKGAFGGSRHGIIQAEADKNLAGTLNGIQVNGLNTGYNNAQSQFNTDRGAMNTGIMTAMQGGMNMGNLATNHQTANMASTDFLNKYGMQGQQWNQAVMDTAYDDFNQARDWDKNQYTWLNEQMRNSGQTKTETTPKTNTWSQLAGAGIAGYGAYKAGQAA